MVDGKTVEDCFPGDNDARAPLPVIPGTCGRDPLSLVGHRWTLDSGTQNTRFRSNSGQRSGRKYGLDLADSGMAGQTRMEEAWRGWLSTDMALWADEAGSNGSNSPRRFVEEHGEIHLKHSRHSSV